MTGRSTEKPTKQPTIQPTIQQMDIYEYEIQTKFTLQLLKSMFIRGGGAGGWLIRRSPFFWTTEEGENFNSLSISVVKLNQLGKANNC